MNQDVATVVGDLSKQLLVSGFTPSAVSSTLRGVGFVLGVDRVYIFENTTNRAGELCCSQRYEWCASDANPQIDNPELQEVPYQMACPAWVEPLSNDEIVVGLVRLMPDQATREILESQQIKSILVCPISVKGKWWGFVGFDDCHSDRQWDSDEIRVLRMLARSLSGALRHAQMQQVLEEARAQLRGVVDFCARPYPQA